MKQLTAFAIFCLFLGMVGGYIGNELTIVLRRWRYNRKNNKRSILYRLCNSCDGSGKVQLIATKSQKPSKCITCAGTGKIEIE